MAVPICMFDFIAAIKVYLSIRSNLLLEYPNKISIFGSHVPHPCLNQHNLACYHSKMLNGLYTLVH